MLEMPRYLLKLIIGKELFLMKVKIFSSPDKRILEEQINEWLAANSWIKVLNITQSSGSSTVVSIWYNEPDVPILG
ncbi:MAG: hypothetical protein ACYCV0_13105 [Desulfitobacteriaceae bacterium]